MHTPTPWKDGPVFQKDGRALFVMDDTKPGKWQKRLDDKTGVFTQPDAAFIVQACNAHDALVARVAELEGACNTALADLTLHKARHLAKRGYEDTVAVLRAALAKR